LADPPPRSRHLRAGRAFIGRAFIGVLILLPIVASGLCMGVLTFKLMRAWAIIGILLGISSIVAALAIGRSTVAAVMGGVFVLLLPADYLLGVVMQSNQASGYRRYPNSGAVTPVATGAVPTAIALALNYGGWRFFRARHPDG
jgi:uncharacterized membrane protein